MEIGQLLGRWQGEVHRDMGGYKQTLEFFENGQVSTCIASLPAKIGNFSIKHDTEISFPILEIKFPEISDYIVPYILKFDTPIVLHLCCPFLTEKLPRAFEGPGYVVMAKVTEQSEFSGNFHQNSLDIRVKNYLKGVIEVLLRMDVVGNSFESEISANKAAIALMSTLTKIDSLAHKFGSDVLDFLENYSESPCNSSEIDRLVKFFRKLALEKGVSSSLRTSALPASGASYAPSSATLPDTPRTSPATTPADCITAGTWRPTPPDASPATIGTSPTAETCTPGSSSRQGQPKGALGELARQGRQVERWKLWTGVCTVAGLLLWSSVRRRARGI